MSERQVCRYVHDKRRELGEVGEVFVPLISDAGVEAEVDWGQAKVRLRGELVEVHLFEMRACFSGAAFVMAFRVRDPAGVPGGARPRAGVVWRASST